MSPERYLPESLGPGCAFLDYDNDGWMDIYLVNSGPSDFYTPKQPLRNALVQKQSRRHLHRRHREGRRSGRHDFRHGRGGGRLRQRRLSRTCSSPPTAARILYHNNGNGTFTDVTEKAGLAVPGWTTSAVWFDYDNDGRLDLFVCSFVDYTNKLSCGDNKLGQHYYCIPRVFKPTHSFLFHNNGDGTFTDVTRGTDIERAMGKGLGVVATDINNDGRMDLFVANDTVQNFLFVNRGNDKWEEMALVAEVGFSESGRRAPAWAWMPPISTATAGRTCSWPTSTRRCFRSTPTTRTKPFPMPRTSTAWRRLRACSAAGG